MWRVVKWNKVNFDDVILIDVVYVNSFDMIFCELEGIEILKEYI